MKCTLGTRYLPIMFLDPVSGYLLGLEMNWIMDPVSGYLRDPRIASESDPENDMDFELGFWPLTS